MTSNSNLVGLVAALAVVFLPSCFSGGAYTAQEAKAIVDQHAETLEAAYDFAVRNNIQHIYLSREGDENEERYLEDENLNLNEWGVHRDKLRAMLQEHDLVSVVITGTSRTSRLEISLSDLGFTVIYSKDESECQAVKHILGYEQISEHACFHAYTT